MKGAATACAAQTAGTGSISGVVRDAGTGAPVADAVVSVQLRDGRVATAAVDAQGQYTLDYLLPGTYRIEASAPLEKGQAVTPQQEKTLRLEPGQNLTAIDFLLPPMGAITGRVLDENVKPVPGAPVVLVEKRYDHGALRYRFAGGYLPIASMGCWKTLQHLRWLWNFSTLWS